jgi:Uma2 family endonuclease
MTVVDDALAAQLKEHGVILPPTEDELPYSDGVPMESQLHVLQMILLMEPLWHHWAGRDVFIGGNMFIYFSLEQVRRSDFPGPDVFVVLDVPRRPRKSWVVWQEGKGLDLVIELLSETTAAVDKGEKKRIYQDQLRVPEYVWYDLETGELAGFSLKDGAYVPMVPEADGRLVSSRLDLSLVRWQGEFGGVEVQWLRWATRDGTPLPTAQELSDQERARAEAAERRIAELEAQLARERRARDGPHRGDAGRGRDAT